MCRYYDQCERWWMEELRSGDVGKSSGDSIHCHCHCWCTKTVTSHIHSNTTSVLSWIGSILARQDLVSSSYRDLSRPFSSYNSTSELIRCELQKIQKIHRSCSGDANTLPQRMDKHHASSAVGSVCHKISIGIAYYYSLTMSNLAPIAPQFTAAGPTTLVLKEKKGLTLSGTELMLILVLASSYIVLCHLIARRSFFALSSNAGDSGKIKDANGNVVFKINAQLVTLSERRTLTDSSGTALGQLRRKKTPGLHATYYLGTMNDEKKCAVKAKG